ncbi:MAG: M23 family metallopeptidase [Rhodobacteraceae bacterium]|nr:M23 family metallopeptidase [Paracoccaceae bacterium]
MDVTGGFTDRLDAALARFFPERRVFLKTDAETRFVRLRPLTQAVGFAGTAVILGWCIIATSILIMDSIGSGNLRTQAAREKVLYESRLALTAAERDARAAEAAEAQARFDVALGRISEMQTALLAAEERNRELETGIDVIQATLRRTLAEREAARGERDSLLAAVPGAGVAAATEAGQVRDTQVTLDMLASALGAAALERDAFAAMAVQARQEAEHLALEHRLHEQRTDMILARLEEAVSVSMAPLDRVFRDAGISPAALLDDLRNSRAAREAGLTPIGRSSRGADPSSEEVRAQGILEGFERINLYRLAMQRLPFATPVRAAVRFTSGFGVRRDPKTGRARMHEGIDFAGPHGTPIFATGGGVVKEAGWHSGYGNSVVIQHEFGITTRYAHLTRIHVSEGQRVSRGDRIGDMGSTGRSTGTHLHYEVHVEGRPVNPMTYIRAASDVF